MTKLQEVTPLGAGHVCPEWAHHWKCDEVEHCISGLTDSTMRELSRCAQDCYEREQVELPQDEESRFYRSREPVYPDYSLAYYWTFLSESAQENIIISYNIEYPQEG